MSYEPIFDRICRPKLGFRPGKDVRTRFAVVMSLLKSGYHWVVDAAPEILFDTIHSTGLMNASKRTSPTEDIEPRRTMLQARIAGHV